MISHEVLSFSSSCYSHQMLIIFQVVVPNLRSQEQKKENYPQPFPSHKETPRAGRSHPLTSHTESWYLSSCKSLS